MAAEMNLTRANRAPSVGSVGTGASASSFTALPRYTPRPEPAYLDAIATADKILELRCFDQRDPQSPTATPTEDRPDISASALVLLNTFLDSLLYNFLAKAKSLSLAKLRPAVAEVLKAKLGREALNNADEALEGLIIESESDDEADEPPSSPKSQNIKSPGSWHLEVAFKRMRIRVMVFTELGDFDDEDEDKFLEEDADGKSHQDFTYVSSPSPIYLANIIDYIAERALKIAVESAYTTAKRRTRTTINEDQPLDTAEADRIVVDDIDVERIAMDRTPLGRLWRVWRKNYRLLHPSCPASPSRASGWKNALASPRNSGYSNFRDRKASLDSVTEHVREPQRRLTAEEVPEGQVLESDIAANIPLPMDENDVDQIEVPGLAAVIYDDDEQPTKSELPEELPVRPLSAELLRELPFDEEEIQTDTDMRPQALLRQRSSSVPTMGSLPWRMLPAPVRRAFELFSGKEEGVDEEAVSDTDTETSASGAEETIKADGADAADDTPRKELPENEVPEEAATPRPETDENEPHDAVHDSSSSGYSKSSVNLPTPETPERRAAAEREDKDKRGIAAKAAAAVGATAFAGGAAVLSNQKTSTGSREDSAKASISEGSEGQGADIGVPQEAGPEESPIAAAMVSASAKSEQVYDGYEVSPISPVEEGKVHAVIPPRGQFLPDTGTRRTGDHQARTEHYEQVQTSFAEEDEEYNSGPIGVAQTSNVRIHSQSPSLSSDPRPWAAVKKVTQAQADPARHTPSPDGNVDPGEEYILKFQPQTPVSHSTTTVVRPLHPSPLRPGVSEQTERPREQYESGVTLPDDFDLNINAYDAPQQKQTSSNSATSRSKDGLPRPSSSYSQGRNTLHSSRGSQGSIGVRSVRSVDKASDEARQRDFETLVRSHDTVKVTLTPDHIRDAEPYPSKTSFDRKSTDSASRGGAKSPSFVRRSPPRETNRPPSSNSPKRPMRISDIKLSIASRQDAPHMASNRKLTFAPRDARIRHDDTKDFVDFMRSTGPDHEQVITPLAVASTPRPPNPRQSRPDGPTSAPNRKRMVPREPEVKSANNNELIDFIRNGPPGGPGGEHRIPRTVAPFRSTMDSDDLGLLVNGGGGGGGGGGSTQNSVVSRQSVADSANSMTALLGSDRSEKFSQPSTTTSAPRRTQPKSVLPSGFPLRKSRKPKDPYAIDDSDEDEDDDDFLADMPHLTNGTRHGHSAVKPPATENLADFLRNTDPSQAASAHHTHLNGSSGPTRTTGGRGLSSAAGASGAVMSALGSAAPPPSLGASRAHPHAQPRAGAMPKKKLEARAAGATREGFGGKGFHYSTNDMVDFLRTSGPQDGLGGAAGAAPSPDIPLSKQPSKRGKGKFWSRRGGEVG